MINNIWYFIHSWFTFLFLFQLENLMNFSLSVANMLTYKFTIYWTLHSNGFIYVILFLNLISIWNLCKRKKYVEHLKFKI